MHQLRPILCVLVFGCGDGASDIGEDGKNAHYYGDPDNALTSFACIDGETDLSMGPYVVCLPLCTAMECPTPPEGGTSEPRCDRVGSVDRCFLACTTSAQCPPPMVCIPGEDFCAFERINCTDDMEVCPADMPCRQFGSTDRFYCQYS